MNALRRFLAAALLAGLAGSGVGCQMFENMFYDLQPHRLRMLNRGPGMSSDAYYSVADPLPGDAPSERLNLASQEP
jgi:hypothetical protein